MDDGQHFLHALFDGSLRFLVDLHAEADVLCNGHVREKCIGLKDHAHIALVGRLVGDIGIIERDLAGGGDLKAGDHAQSGRFAAAGRTEEGNELALFHIQIEILNHGGFDRIAWRYR